MVTPSKVEQKDRKIGKEVSFEFSREILPPENLDVSLHERVIKAVALFVVGGSHSILFVFVLVLVFLAKTFFAGYGRKWCENHVKNDHNC